jgi:hypothetical protein
MKTIKQRSDYLTHRAKWMTISVVIYVIFVICAVVFKLLDPAKMGCHGPFSGILLPLG